ncbi:ATP-dependent nuclease [Actinoplanes sp. NPDC051859]|uniref:ATP-dependent nuclease n=1 Tax=Actinoplanes sp. NPDC051859 TaxID=3363909 RepID=UPI0037A613AD
MLVAEYLGRSSALKRIYGGKVAGLSFSIDQIQLKSGAEIKLPPRGITAIVGGNNVGKSTVLRELLACMDRNDNRKIANTKVLRDASLSKIDRFDNLLSWLQENGYYTSAGTYALPGSSPGIADHVVRYLWESIGSLGQLMPFLVHYSEVVSRVGLVGGVSRREDISSPPAHPMHHIEDDEELLGQFNKICVRIFRVPLTLDRLSNTVAFRVGTTNVAAPPVDAVTRDYRDALSSLPLLSEQGDGMRSLMGALLAVMTSSYPVVLIDEPEAFLHPPQAFELGRVLGEIASKREIQIVLATHDRNLVAGLLEVDHDVSIVRLDRDEGNTTASQLQSSEVKLLWSDSVLRYSNVLDGLFHRMVVLAEGEDDCKFYQAALDALDDGDAARVAPSEVLFLPTGGKDGMSKIAKALLSLRVRVVASPDLDLLDNSGKVRKLVESFGGRWDDFKDDYQTAVKPFQVPHPKAAHRDILDAVSSVLGKDPDAPWDGASANAVRAQMRLAESPWKALKLYGMRAFKTGESRAAAKRLLDRLDVLGICLVREGELERFANDIEVSKGPEWLPAAIADGAHAKEEAREHLRRVIGSRLVA